MWTYSQKSGELITPQGVLLGHGYSGHGPGLDNPLLQNIHNVGPIPEGQWTVGAFFDDPGGKGPVVAHLTPCAGTETFGRSGFMVHGAHIGETEPLSSDGCIILAHALRVAIRDSGDSALMVTG